MDTDETASTNDDIDLSRAPLGVRAAAALVQAVANSDDRVERHYLEVKSDIDLRTKNDIAKIAKFILGAANRLPDVARAAFDGYGVMVIGVAPGDARGVRPVEVLELDKIISRYLGASGPKWDVVRVPVPDSGNEVLVVVVDPPQDGQDPFPCRKDGERLHDGRIYIRADGATREANAEELDLLIRRGKYEAAPQVSFEVEVAGAAHPLHVDDSQTIDTYVGVVRRRLLEAFPDPDPEPAGAVESEDSITSVTSAAALHQMLEASRSAQKAVLAAGFTSEPEKRTEVQYRDSIDRWEECVRGEWRDAVDELAGYALDGVVVRVTNAAKVFFHDVEVKVHLEGDVRGIDWRDGSDMPARFKLDLSKPPRAWGPVHRSRYDSIMPSPAHYFNAPILPSTYQSRLDWNNSGSVDLTLDVGDLRPRQTFAWDDDELVLVLPGGTAGEVRGTWEITARDHNEIYGGELRVRIAESRDLTATIRDSLDLD